MRINIQKSSSSSSSSPPQKNQIIQFLTFFRKGKKIYN